MNLSKKILWLFLLFVLFSCKPKNDAVIDLPKTEIALAEISSDNCLNLEKLSSIFQSPSFSVPAAVMTTSLKSVGDISISKLNYFSYATFNYKTANANELGLFTIVRQKDCKTVQMLSASEEVMMYEVTNSSDKEITVRLKDRFRDSMSAAQKKAFYDRQQPYVYHFKYLSANSIEITEKYTTIDSLCATKKQLNFEIRKVVNWARIPAALPQTYEIDAQYINQVKASILGESIVMTEPPITPPTIDTPQVLSVENIRSIMRSPIKDELKLCLL